MCIHSVMQHGKTEVNWSAGELKLTSLALFLSYLCRP